MKRQFLYCLLILWSITSYPMIKGVACNGYSEFCNRRLNEITLLGAHNIGYKKSASQNQKYSVPKLLEMGVRYFKVPVHPVPPALTSHRADAYAYKNKLYIPMACHGLYRASLYSQSNIMKFLHTIDPKELETDHDRHIKRLEKKIAAIEKKVTASRKDMDSCKKNPFQKKCAQALFGTIKEGITALQDNLVAKKALLALKKTERSLKSPLLFMRNLPYKAGQAISGSAKKILIDAFGTDINPGPIPYNPCIGDPSAQPFVTVLNDIKEFLTTNKNEVVILFIEDKIGNIDVLVNAFKKADLLPLVYAHTKGSPWPTLGQLVKNNKRLIVLKTSHSWGDYGWDNYPWIHRSSDYIAKAPGGGFKSAEALLASQKTTMSHYDKTRPDKFIRMPHSVTPFTGGDIKQARKLNTYQALTKRIKQFMSEEQKQPNIITLDFIGVPSIQEQTRAFEHANGVGEFAGKPLVKVETN